jgi:hypothetical protein
VGIQMADIESPQDCPLDLSVTFFTDFIEIGMIPYIDNGTGESAVTI